MTGKRITAEDARRLGTVLRAYEGGQLTSASPPGDELRFGMPAPLVALLHGLTSAQGQDVDSTDTGPEDLPGSAWNVADIPAECIPLEPVDDRVQWIRIVGAELGSNGPQFVQVRLHDFTLLPEDQTTDHATLYLQDKPDDVRQKLIALGLPDDIVVRGSGDTFEDGVAWSQANVWAVRFPTIANNDRQFPLEWYDDPDTLSLVARVDAFPWWPRLERAKVWKPFPSRDAIPGGAFLRASWVWGRGYVADHLECVL